MHLLLSVLTEKDTELNPLIIFGRGVSVGQAVKVPFCTPGTHYLPSWSWGAETPPKPSPAPVASPTLPAMTACT